MPSSDFNGPVDFIRSPSKNLSACHQMQHLFLQVVRSLLQFVPSHVTSQQVEDVVHCMLEVRVRCALHVVAIHSPIFFADLEF